MAPASLSIAVVGDDVAHGVLGRSFVDAVLSARGSAPLCRRWWLEDGGAVDLRGCSDGYYRAKDVRADLRQLKGLPSGRSLHLRRRREGKVVVGDSAFDDVFQLFGLLSDDGPDLIVMLRDTDGEADRRTPAIPVLDELDPVARPARMVVGLPHPEAEGWFILSMEAPPADRLAVARKTLGFDPTQAPERLRSSGDANDAKRVLQFLTFHAEALARAPSRALPREQLESLLDGLHERLDDLRQRGQGCGLGAFLDALERDLTERLRELDTGAPATR